MSGLPAGGAHTVTLGRGGSGERDVGPGLLVGNVLKMQLNTGQQTTSKR